MRTWIFLLLAAWLSPTLAHTIHHRVEASQAVILTLTYSSGKPYAREPYSLYAEGSEQAGYAGQTDAEGRIVFVPGDAAQWHLKAQGHHGHGLVIDFTVPVHQTTSSQAPAMPAVAAPSATLPTPTPVAGPTSSPNEASLALFGLSLLLGGFGAYQLFLKRLNDAKS